MTEPAFDVEIRPCETGRGFWVTERETYFVDISRIIGHVGDPVVEMVTECAMKYAFTRRGARAIARRFLARRRRTAARIAANPPEVLS